VGKLSFHQGIFIPYRFFKPTSWMAQTGLVRLLKETMGKLNTIEEMRGQA